MDADTLREMLADVAEGRLRVDDAAEKITAEPFLGLGLAAGAQGQALRDGTPGLVTAAGKTPRQVAAAARRAFDDVGRLIVTRVEPAHLEALRLELPEMAHDIDGRLAWYDPNPRPRRGSIAVVAAGQEDVPVAEEAAVTAEMIGACVARIYEPGACTLHRLADRIGELREATAVVAVAGAESGLPGLVASLVANPVVAVPTSTGIGASFGGLAALLAMLTASAPGVAVVNIDNGYGAGYYAATINRVAAAGGGRRRTSRPWS